MVQNYVSAKEPPTLVKETGGVVQDLKVMAFRFELNTFPQWFFGDTGVSCKASVCTNTHLTADDRRGAGHSRGSRGFHGSPTRAVPDFDGGRYGSESENTSLKWGPGVGKSRAAYDALL